MPARAAPANKPTKSNIGLGCLGVIAVIVVAAMFSSRSNDNAGSPGAAQSTDADTNIVGSAYATSSSQPPDSFRGIKWDSALPTPAKLRSTVLKGCLTIQKFDLGKDEKPCSHFHTDTDDMDMYTQRTSVPQFLNVLVSEQLLSWSNKKFWSGQVFSHTESDFSKFRQALISEYGPPTFENRSRQITKWKWSAPRKVVIQLTVDNFHTVSLLFAQDE